MVCYSQLPVKIGLLNEPNFIAKLQLEDTEVFKSMLQTLYAIYGDRNIKNVADEIVFLNAMFIGLEMSYCINDSRVRKSYFETSRRIFLERYKSMGMSS